MPNPNPNVAGMHMWKQERQFEKCERLLNGRPKWKDEKLMDAQDVEDYIAHMKDAITDDNKVASVLLKWLELKNKHADNVSDIDKIDAIVKRGLEYAESLRTTSTSTTDTADE